MSDKLADLPDGWASTTLSAIGKWQTGGTPSRSRESYFGGKIPWVKSGDLRDGVVTCTDETITDEAIQSSAAKVIAKGSVAIALYGATIGRVGILGIDAATNQACASCTVDKNVSDSKFLFHYLISQRSHFIAAGQGGAQPNLTNEIVRKWPLSLPPLHEQLRIVAKIEALQSRSRKAREALEAIPPLLEQFRQSVLAAAFRGDLTADWREQNPDVEPASVLLDRIRTERRQKWEESELAKFKSKGKVPKDDAWKERYVEPEPIDDTNLPELPEGWCWARFGDVISELRNGIGIKPEPCPPGHPILRISSVRPGRVLFDDVRYFRGAVTSNDFIQNGDLLFTRYNGTLELLAVCGMVRGQSEGKYLYPDKLMRVRIGHQFILPEYVELFFSSPDARRAIEQSTKSSAGQQGISGTDIKAQYIAIPPLTEQKTIVKSVLELLAHSLPSLTDCEELFTKLNTLDQSILAKAFRGELVPQDANDEPASVLLERIRAERSVQSTSSTSRRKKVRTVE